MEINEYLSSMVKTYGADITRWYLQNKRMNYFHEYGKYPSKEDFISYINTSVGTSTISSSVMKALAPLSQYKNIVFENREQEQKQNYFNKSYKIWTQKI